MNEKTNYIAGGLLALALVCATGLTIAGKMPPDVMKSALGGVVLIGATLLNPKGAAGTVVNSLGGMVGVSKDDVRK